MKKEYVCLECGTTKYSLASIGGHLQSHQPGLKKKFWHLYIKGSDNHLKGNVRKVCKLKKIHKKSKSKSFKHILNPKFYSSREWRKLRYEALVKHGNSCMVCGASPMDGIVIHVDHIKPRSLHPELALKLDNLQILCKDCNLGKSNIDDTDWRLDEDLVNQIKEMEDEFSDIVRH